MNEQHDAYLLGLAMGKLTRLIEDAAKFHRGEPISDSQKKLQEIHDVLAEIASKYYKKPEAEYEG